MTRTRRRRVATVVATALVAGLATAGITTLPAAADPPTLRVTNPALVFTTGDVPITLTSSATSVDWTLADPQGLPLRNGSTSVAGGGATVDFDDLGPGHYELSITATTGGESTEATGTFAVMDPVAVDQRGSVYGAGTHVFATYKSEQLPVIDIVGIGLLRIDVSWRIVETAKGVYTWPAWLDTAIERTIAAGARPQLIANYANPLYDGGATPSSPEALAAFAEFAAAIVDRYGADDVDLAVWNEYTLNSTGDCGDSAECYAEMVRVVSQRVKQDHPQVVVMASTTITGTSGLAHTDSVSAHLYGYPEAPETFLAERLTDARAKLDATPDGVDVPIWLDEFGWPTHDNGGTSVSQQADYLIRSEVIALANHAERLYWYDLVNDGWDDGARENQFGLLWLSRNGFSGLTPKPALASQATVIRQLGDLELRSLRRLDDAAQVGRFTGAGKPDVHVLWATEPRTLAVSTSQPLTVTDRFGAQTTLAPTGGRVTLAVDGHPVFVKGAILGVDVVEAPTVRFTVPDRLAVGEAGEATVSLDCRVRQACREFGRALDVTVQGRTVRVPVTLGELTEQPIALTAPTRQGEYQAVATVTKAGRTIASLSGSTLSVPATEISAVADLSSVDPTTGRIAVTITNNTRSAVPLGEVVWQRDDQTLTLEAPDRIPAGESITTEVPDGPVELWADYRWTITADIDDRPVTARGSTGFGPVLASGETPPDPIDLAELATFTYASRDWGGPDDLSGTVTPSWTETHFVIDAEIVDNVFTQQNTAQNLWRSDSIQFAVSDGIPGSNLRESMEIGVALLPEGPVVYSFPPLNFGSRGVTPGGVARITRDGAVTRYHVEVPWTSLDLDGPPDRDFGLSIVANDDDNDGLGRAGFAEWGSGITGTKSPALFRPVQLIRH